MHTRQGVAASAHSELTITEISGIPFRPPVLAGSCCCTPSAEGLQPHAVVWNAIAIVLGLHGPMKRLTFSVHVGALMASQGWRFCRCYRQQVSSAHSAVYALLDPVQANFAAEDVLKRAGL